MKPALRGVRRRLTSRQEAVERSADLPAQLHRASKAFKQARQRVRRWSPPSKPDWAALAGGLRDTYREARQAMHTAYQRGHEPPEVAFHDWRKAVKYHGHHMRLLADVAPGLVQPRLDGLDQLGELLGEDHDLAVFAQTLRDEPDGFANDQDRRTLEETIAQRQKWLRDKARPLGESLFAQPPRAFTAGLEQHWHRWRAGRPTDGQNKPAPSASATHAAVASRLR